MLDTRYFFWCLPGKNLPSTTNKLDTKLFADISRHFVSLLSCDGTIKISGDIDYSTDVMQVSNDRKSDLIEYVGVSHGGIDYGRSFVTRRRCISMEAKKKGIEAYIGGNTRHESVEADQVCDTNERRGERRNWERFSKWKTSPRRGMELALRMQE